MSDDFFDGETWNRTAVLAAQHAAVNRKASRFGLEVLPRNLLRDPLSESFVAEFERIHRCTLPYEYRSFLLQVGDGGDGPGVLMRQLGAPFEDSNSWEQGQMYGGPLEPNIRLDKEFPYVDAVPEDPAFLAALEAGVFPEEFIVDPADAGSLGFPGSLYLFDHGAALWDMLIITGASRGEMWADRGADGAGCMPIMHDGRRVGFAAHYCAWLNGQDR